MFMKVVHCMVTTLGWRYISKLTEAIVVVLAAAAAATVVVSTTSCQYHKQTKPVKNVVKLFILNSLKFTTQKQKKSIFNQGEDILQDSLKY
jgi:hypothetical protein